MDEPAEVADAPASPDFDAGTRPANGLKSGASLAALPGGSDAPALSVVTDAQFGALTNRVGALESAFADMEFRLSEMDDALRSGVAAAMAMADAPMPSEGGKTSYMGKAATFRGKLGFSLGLTHRLPTDAPFAISAASAMRTATIPAQRPSPASSEPSNHRSAGLPVGQDSTAQTRLGG